MVVGSGTRSRLAAVGAVIVWCTVALAQGPLDQWLSQVTGADGAAREAALERAAEIGSPAVVPLGETMTRTDLSAAKGAEVALQRIVHAASAPGRETERRAVAQGLCELLSHVEAPGTVRAKWVRLLAFVGEEESVPLLGRLLDDAELAEDARQTLQRIPAPAAGDALRETLQQRVEADGGWDPLVPALIDALAARGDREAMPLLWQLTRHGDVEVRLAALHGIGVVGDLRDADRLVWEFYGGGGHISAARTRALLRLAEAALERGQREPARRMYERVLYHGPGTGERMAALTALERLDDPASLSTLVRSLGDWDPTFRALALKLIVRWADDPVRTMKMALPTPAVYGRQEAGVLTALAELDDGTVAPVLMGALDQYTWWDEVKAAAAAGLAAIGYQEAAPKLLELAEGDDEGVRPPALNAYLSLMLARLEVGPREGLAEAFRHGLEIAEQDAERNLALQGVAALGDAGARELVEPLTLGEGTRTAALDAYFAIGKTLAAQGEREQAEEVLRSVVARGAPREVAEACKRELQAIGIEIDLAQAAGFVTDWWLVGGFPDQDRKGFDVVYPPEQGIDLDRGVEFDGRTLPWTKYHTEDLQGIVPLENSLQPNQNVVAYAYAVLAAEREEDVTLRIGSDDAVKCWINGELVHANNAYRPLRVDEDTATGHLRAGENEILVKITQGGGGWEFCLRVVRGDR